MNTKKIPLRSCVITKEKLPKKELVRVVRTVSGNVEIDLTGKLNGRGAYLKKDESVFKKAKETKVLERILGVKVDENVYNELNSLLK